MELSGLIFVALALVWAVVLIPKALRHHDEVARTRSVADVSDEGRVVARRTSATAAPAAPAEGRLPTAPKPTPQTSPAKTSKRPKTSKAPRTSGARDSGTPSRSATARAAARRRRILAVLLVADLGVGAAALVGVLASWAPVVPVILTVAFLVVARITVRRDQARRRRARLAAQRRRAMQPVQPAGAAAVEPASPSTSSGGAEATRVETTAPAAEASPVEITNEQGFNVISGLDDTSSIPVVRLASDGSGSLWDPLPVTLPTYVTKPRASRSVRTIDLSAPGVSSSGRSSAASALVAEAATAAATTTGKGDSARAVGS